MQALAGFISDLYCQGADIGPHRFRRWALDELRNLVHFDAAVWGSGPTQANRFHNVTVSGLPSSFAQALEETREMNPLLPKIRERLGRSVAMSDVMSDRKFFGSELYHRTFQPFGVERILSSAHMEPRSGLYTLLTIYRFERKKDFTKRERGIQDQVLFHMIRAAAHSFFLEINRPTDGKRREFRAVCDALGHFHEVESGFMDLLDREFPDWDDPSLPFEMPDSPFDGVVGTLHLRVEPMEDLYLLHLRPSGPLDDLTERERDVVLGVCDGLSAKAIGRNLGLAPSTVSTHLYRAYRKLGVESRTNLAKLVKELRG